jgi:hypothetical protein
MGSRVLYRELEQPFKRSAICERVSFIRHATVSRTFTRIATVHVSGEVFWWLSTEESFGWGARLTEEAAASLHTLLTPGLSGSQPYAALDALERVVWVRIPIIHNHSIHVSATAARDLDQKALPL